MAGMGYVVLRTDLATLKTIDLPAIAEIATGKGKRRFAVISALRGSRATVLVSSKEMEIDVDQLGSLLTGSMIIYCSDSFVNPQVLHAGMEIDLNIRKLQDYLKELDYFDGNCSGWFTEDTQNAVTQFQADNGLNTAGNVTGYMKLLMYSRFPHGENEIPRLAR
jgi:hypothetical protein